MKQKKKINVFLLGILICLVFIGCSFDPDSSEYVKVEITPLTDGGDQESAGTMEGTEQQDSGGEDGTVQEQAAGGQTGGSSGARINEQSFDVMLRPLGQVTFASYEPDISENPLAEITVEAAKGFIGAGEEVRNNLEPWQQAYIEYLTNDSEVESNRGYTLILLSNDEIPELVEVGIDEATGCRIVCYADGRVHVNQTNRLYFSYIPGENLLCNSEGNMDYYYDLVYRLSGGDFEMIASGYYGAADNSRVEFDEEGNPVYQYEWNGVKMSEDEYQKELFQVYDLSKAATYDHSNLYSVDEIKKIIEDYQ